MSQPNQLPAIRGTEQKVIGSHKQAVSAGTVVNLWIAPGNAPQAAQAAQDTLFHWRVTGPFTNQVLTEYTSDQPTFDFDTEGLRAASYTITVRAEPAGTQTPQPPTAAATASGTVDEGLFATTTDAGTDQLTANVRRTAASSSTPMGWTIQVTNSGLTSVSQEGIVPVSLQRTGIAATPDQVLWVIIRNRAAAISFNQYRPFIDSIMCSQDPKGLSFQGPDAYQVLKTATDAFLMQETGILNPDIYDLVKRQGKTLGQGTLNEQTAEHSLRKEFSTTHARTALELEEGRRLNRPTFNQGDVVELRDAYYQSLTGEMGGALVLPYLNLIRDRLSDIPLKPDGTVPNNCYGILKSKLLGPPAIELIWSYWLEEGMLAQTLNVILARFQGRKLRSGRDPLSRMYLDPLRPLGNLLWGWIQDDYHRLTVRRRAKEYEHEYGLNLIGAAIPPIASVDRRSKFVESLHNLIFKTHVFYKEDDDTTIIADGFPVLNALRETHLLLAEGADNQFGDLPTTSRAEFLIMQWLLARPEMRDFLGGRPMVPYEEPWMDRVDTMKSIQGWTDATVTHFRDMAVFGEQLLLSVRYGNWSVENDQQTAANWARYWRSEMQRYTHAYRSATGVDLSEEVDATTPAVLLRRRMMQQTKMAQ